MGVGSAALSRAAGIAGDILAHRASIRVPKLVSAPAAPRFLTYTVTFACNARCIMCDSWKMSSRDDLSTDEAEHILSRLPPMDAVRLTGGEPFVRKDFTELAEMVLAYQKPSLLHVTTNGFLVDRVVDFVESRDRGTPLHLLVSVDGVGDKHNEVRGRDIAWQRVTETLRALGPRQKRLNLRLSVNQTIVDPDGIEHYRKLREFLRPLGVSHHVVMAYETSATYSLENEADLAPGQAGAFSTFGDFTSEHLQELLSEVETDLHELPYQERLAKRYYLRGIESRLIRKEASPNPPCVALTSHLRLFPNGDVPTCQFNGKTIGNLRKNSYQQVWQGIVAHEQRRWVRECPGCWAECEVLPSAVYTGDLVRDALPTLAGTLQAWFGAAGEAAKRHLPVTRG